MNKNLVYKVKNFFFSIYYFPDYAAHRPQEIIQTPKNQSNDVSVNSNDRLVLFNCLSEISRQNSLDQWFPKFFSNETRFETLNAYLSVLYARTSSEFSLCSAYISLALFSVLSKNEKCNLAF